jgi:large subunit ribosomal protein L10
MKNRATKQKDLNALTEELKNANSAMVVSFNKLTVTKDQEFRNKLRETGAKYQVVKNTLARIAVKDTQFAGASAHFKGVTALAWTSGDAVILSKTVTKFVKDNKEVFTFKAGVVEGRVYDVNQVEAIANLPSKEELISKLLFVINAQAQRIATVINAVPRNLAIVIKQIGEQKGEVSAVAEQKVETAAQPEPVDSPAEVVEVEATQPESTAQVSEPTAEVVEVAEAVEAEAVETATSEVSTEAEEAEKSE